MAQASIFCLYLCFFYYFLPCKFVSTRRTATKLVSTRSDVHVVSFTILVLLVTTYFSWTSYYRAIYSDPGFLPPNVEQQNRVKKLSRRFFSTCFRSFSVDLSINRTESFRQRTFLYVLFEPSDDPFETLPNVSSLRVEIRSSLSGKSTFFFLEKRRIFVRSSSGSTIASARKISVRSRVSSHLRRSVSVCFFTVLICVRRKTFFVRSFVRRSFASLLQICAIIVTFSKRRVFFAALNRV